MQKLFLEKYIINQKLVGGVVLSLAALNLLFLSETVWLGASLAHTPALPGGGTDTVKPRVSTDPEYNLQSLLGVPLFGVKPVVASKEPEIYQDVRKSALKIRVIGLIASEGEDGGAAVLQYAGKTKAYTIGEKIDVPGSVKLLAVYADYIVIENNRKQEKLELDKKRPVRGVTTTTPRVSEVDARDLVDLNDARFTSVIGDPRDMIQNSPLKLAQFFAVSPVEEAGQVVGYSIKPGRDPRLFTALELKDGDTVLSVNGQALTDLPPAELLKLMENTTSFELLVDRNGTILSKRLDL